VPACVQLLDNAVRYTREGAVSLGVTCRGLSAASVRLRVAVSDTGTGIPPALLPRLFVPFALTEAAASHGSGLGICVCERLVKALGAPALHVASEPGRGTRFWFDLGLPLAYGRALHLHRTTPHTEGAGSSMYMYTYLYVHADACVCVCVCVCVCAC
jgi:K+-sensing histidine kinase KdpD